MTALVRLDDAGRRFPTRSTRASRVTFRHPVFHTVDDPFFRISEVERKPVMIIRLDDKEASLPVLGLMREFKFNADDEDGAMLGMIIRALDFVCGLRIGDQLPTEILTGEASWVADEAFHDRAMARLNIHLLTWASNVDASVSQEIPSGPGRLSMSSANLEHGLRCISSHIGGMTPDDALIRLQLVASEFAYIDSLRDWLLRGAQRLGTALDRLANNFRGDHTHKELLMRLRRLAAVGIADLQARFDEVDRVITDIVQVVAQPDAIIPIIRDRRDNLYVRGRAWEPFTTEWATIQAGHNTRTWQLAHETYRFLAPRFMTVMEWKSSMDRAISETESRPGMTW